MKKSVYGVIDIGSLKVKLLIAEVKNGNIEILYKEPRLTLLGKGLKEGQHRILSKSLSNSLKAVKYFQDICNKYNVKAIKMVATESIRKADNVEEVLESFKNGSGNIPEIISQEDEAELFFKAVTRNFPKDKKVAVVDMGGGSIQILIGKRGEKCEMHFVPLGVYFLQQKFVTDTSNEGKPSDEELALLRGYIQGVLHASNVPMDIETPLIYGSSNVLDLFNMIPIKKAQSTLSSTHPYEVIPEELPVFLDEIKDLSHAQREKKYPLQWGYMWGIQMAFYNAYYLAKRLGSKVIIPSNVNISEGYILSMV